MIRHEDAGWQHASSASPPWSRPYLVDASAQEAGGLCPPEWLVRSEVVGAPSRGIQPTTGCADDRRGSRVPRPKKTPRWRRRSLVRRREAQRVQFPAVSIGRLLGKRHHSPDCFDDDAIVKKEAPNSTCGLHRGRRDHVAPARFGFHFP